MPWAIVAATLTLVAVHVFAGHMRLPGIPRSRWLSFSGGAAVAYVFLHLLPELSAHQRTVAGHLSLDATATPTIYLVALVGLMTFYGLERHARRVARRRRPDDNAGAGGSLFRLHEASFAAYNLLIGYLLVHRERPGVGELGLYTLAIALHFLAADHGLREHYGSRYDRVARWWFAAAVVAGAAIGAVVELPPTAIAILFAFLAGGIVLNVLKDELPAERESAFVPFAAGAGGYGLLLWMTT